MATLSALASASFKEIIAIQNTIICPSEYPVLSLMGFAAASPQSYWTFQKHNDDGTIGGYRPAAGTTFVGLGLIAMARPSSGSPVYIYSGDNDIGVAASSGMTNGEAQIIAMESPTSGDVIKRSFLFTVDGASGKYLGGYWLSSGSGNLTLNLIGFEIPTPNY